MSRDKLLVVTTEFGAEADGSYRPSGMAQFSRCVLKALVRSGRYARVDAWGLCDSSGGAAWLEREYLAPDCRGGAYSVRGFASNRRGLGLEFLRHHWHYDRVMFLHVNVARLSVLRPIQPHTLWLVGIEVRRSLAWHERWAVARSTPLLSISQYSSDAMQLHNPSLPSGRVVHLCIEPDGPWSRPTTRDAAPPKYVASERESAVLIVGRLSASERYKGHDQLLEAWPQVLRERPLAELWVAGDGDDRSRLQARAAELGITERVRFFGKVSHSELGRLYATARAFAMPSTGEGFGLVFVEAMKYGLPCICSTDSAQEIVIDGQTGIVTAQTPSKLAEACLALLRDDALCDRYSAQGQTRALEQFTFDAFEARLTAALHA
jgi:phosphatidylinositol alpha-1,6-mannosyltransferase